MLPQVLRKRKASFQQILETVYLHIQARSYDEAFQLCQKVRKQVYTKQKLLLKPNSVIVNIYYAAVYSLFGLGHIHQAEEWVQEYGVLTNRESNYRYLAAYLCLHHRQTEQALLHWTSILQMDPSQTFADQLIERFKRNEKQVLSEIEDARYLSRYLPFDFPKKKQEADTPLHIIQEKDVFWKAILLGIVLSTISIGSGIFFFSSDGTDAFSFIFRKDAPELPQAPSEGTALPPSQYKDQAPRFVYQKRNELIDLYNTARQKIIKGKVNQARYLLGKIELSNASFEIKERALLLRETIPLLQLREFHDHLSLARAKKTPYMYRDAQVYWKGRLKFIRPRRENIELEIEGASQTRLFVFYAATDQQRKDLLTALNQHNFVRVFGIFIGTHPQGLKVQASRFIF